MSDATITRTVYGLNKGDIKQFGDLVVKANMEQVKMMADILIKEHNRRKDRGCKY